MLPTLLGDGLAVERDRGLFLAELLAGSAPVVAPSAAAETSGDVSQRATARQNATRRGPSAPMSVLRSRTRHELDRAAERLRQRFAYRPSHRQMAEPRWRWTDSRARGCEQEIRGLPPTDIPEST